MRRLSFKQSLVQKSENYQKPTRDDMPEFLQDCKAFSGIHIDGRKEGATPYLERVLGWKIKKH